MSLLSHPGAGTPVVPSGGWRDVPSPTQDAVMGCPVSVCHQWSKTGAPNALAAHLAVSISQCSPATNSVLKLKLKIQWVQVTLNYNETQFGFSQLKPHLDKSKFLLMVACGSSRFMTRSAVGAVNKHATLWSFITLKNDEESGVPTGFP